MESFLIYLFKASALLGIFYLSYLFLLKRETSFQLNRKFLIAGLLTSIILPSVYFTKKVYIEASPQSFDFIASTSEMSHVPVEAQTDWWYIGGLLYLIITGFFILRLSLQLSSVLKIIISHNFRKVSGFKYLETSENQLPFSFFNFIVFNPEKHSKKDLELILEHEKVHARQLHSADILLVNIMSCILWFNPFAWLYKKSVEQNLEFIADRETVNSKAEIKDYQHALVKVSIADLRPALTNHFYQSFIKKRILMLNKKSSTQSPAWKLSLVMPLLLAFMLLFNVKTEAQVVTQQETEEKPEKVESPEVVETEDLEIEEVVEINEEAEVAEEVEVEFVEAPEVVWTTARSPKPENSISQIGVNPLYVINGKKYKASKLKNKYIGLRSRLEILDENEAQDRYGEDAQNGAIIIPDAEIIRNFDKELKEIEGRSFSGRYLMVGENGRPNFLNLNSGKNAVPARATFYSSGREYSGSAPFGTGRTVKVWNIDKSPSKARAYAYVNSNSNSNKDHAVYEFRTDGGKVRNFGTTGKVASFGGKSKVEFITQDGDPLYVVNNEIKDSDFDVREMETKSIAYVKVLKGDSATEKYGKKAENGVIEITTKDSPDSDKDQKLVKIHAGMSDAELDQAKARLKEMTGIDLSIDNISRNDGLITSIRVTSQLDGRQISNGHFEDTNSIPNIYVGLVNGNPIVKSSRD